MFKAGVIRCSLHSGLGHARSKKFGNHLFIFKGVSIKVLCSQRVCGHFVQTDFFPM